MSEIATKMPRIKMPKVMSADEIYMSVDGFANADNT